MIKKTCAILMFPLISLNAQDPQETFNQAIVQVEGSITYILSDMVYADLGKDAGAAVGDSLEVKHKAETIGFIVVTNLSRNSSSCVIVWSKTAIQVGDRVLLDKKVVTVREKDAIDTTVVR